LEVILNTAPKRVLHELRVTGGTAVTARSTYRST